jgi:hypothetical protein
MTTDNSRLCKQAENETSSVRVVSASPPVATTRARDDRTAARGLTRIELDQLAFESKFGLDGWWKRFWSKVDKTGEHWHWRGSKTGKYGFVTFGPQGKKRKVLAHRVAFVYVHGDLAPGEDALHDCRHKDCVRCLRRGTQAENNKDMVRDGTAARGERHGLSQRSKARAKEMAAAFDADQSLTCAKLAERYGVTLPTVYRAVHQHATRKPVRSTWWARGSM